MEKAIDGKVATGWGIFPRVGEPHQAVFELKQAVMVAEGERMAIELDQLHGQRHLIGRFRLSVTDKAPPVRAPALPVDLLSKLARPETERSEAERKELFEAHRLVFVNEQLARLPAEQKVWAIAADFPPLRNYKPVKEPYPIHILRRGDITHAAGRGEAAGARGGEHAAAGVSRSPISRAKARAAPRWPSGLRRRKTCSRGGAS